MVVNPRRVLGYFRDLPVLTSLALVLAGEAPIVLVLACLAVTVTFVLPAALVLVILIPLGVFLFPILQVCRSWFGWSWSWVCMAHGCPWLWSWLCRSWLLWPWICWRWLR
jgi:hypothetical protein